jgi:hypothetical protein
MPITIMSKAAVQAYTPRIKTDLCTNGAIEKLFAIRGNAALLAGSFVMMIHMLDQSTIAGKVNRVVAQRATLRLGHGAIACIVRRILRSKKIWESEVNFTSKLSRPHVRVKVNGCGVRIPIPLHRAT